METTIKEIPSRCHSQYTYSNAFHVLGDRISQWYACRHALHKEWREGDENILYLNAKYEPNDYKKLVREIEDKIGIINKAKFFKTQFKNITYIEPNWWGKNELRRQLFSILIRNGERYNNLEECIDIENRNFGYLYGTKNAIELFMKGYTNIKDKAGMGWYIGWRRVMEGKGLEELKEILIFDGGA